ncbi:hypothetical protein BDW02DRAFT_642038 [Decorospora gaudefroyi]|uniref:Glycosyl transferase family 25 domain-containing protein n=1 Tax=Decorospora gaudefroyi TaxID=184978 RepID=A0A6A5K0X5_9PLEO|nr:hypothetical protein BDW02DRAFT_642038 [Decorospora gaudefroyi]
MGLMSPKTGATFEAVKRRSGWRSAPRLLTTCVFFAVLWVWLNLTSSAILIPTDSFEYLKDEGLKEILNTTLGFEKIFVLNLPSRTDRRDAITLSSAVSNIKLEFVEGVTGASIHDKAYPPPEANKKLLSGIRGSWRTHMNALQRVVEQNLTTALIFEDDVDWDLRVRQNLQRFALASRFLSSSSKQYTSTLQSKLEHHTNTETPATAIQIIDTSTLPKTLHSLPLSSLPSVTKPTRSPYGDPTNWDILWLGHCGAGMPRPPPHPPSTPATDLSLLTLPNDATVPSARHLKAHPFQSDPDALATTFPPHTRIYHAATGGTLCTVAYAVSQRGARRLLHQFAMQGWSAIFDAELGRWCAGYDPDLGRQSTPSKTAAAGGGRDAHGKERVCLTTQPPIFSHHHPRGGQSDIGGLGGGYATKYETKYLRYSVRMNLEKLVWGREGEVVDQWPDEEDGV